VEVPFDSAGIVVGIVEATIIGYLISMAFLGLAVVATS
jgi:hypothetical protein